MNFVLLLIIMVGPSAWHFQPYSYKSLACFLGNQTSASTRLQMRWCIVNRQARQTSFAKAAPCIGYFPFILMVTAVRVPNARFSLITLRSLYTLAANSLLICVKTGHTTGFTSVCKLTQTLLVWMFSNLTP